MTGRTTENQTTEKLEGFFRTFHGAAHPALLLDYDGTLAPFRVDRFKARPWAGVRQLLSRIQQQGVTQLVVITGRPAGEIVPLLGLEPPPEVWGLHGVERLLPDGRRELQKFPAAARHALDDLRLHLRRDAFGALLEEKYNAVVLHWRGVPRGKAAIIEKRAHALFEPAVRVQGLVLLEFEAGLELRAGGNKGGAVRAILAETSGRGARPVAYLGDDLTDEAAFRAVKGHGLAVLVRREPRATAADLWLRPPSELRGFLEQWLHACSALNPRSIRT